MEQELSLEQHKIFLEHSTAIVTVLDEDGTITYQSPAINRVLGYDASSLVGDSAFDYIHPDDLESAESTFNAIIEEPENERSVEYRFEDVQGDWSWLRSNGINYLDHSEVNGIVVNSIDITDLKEQQHRHVRVLESVNDGVVLIQDGVISYVNPRMVDLTGYDPAEAIGEPFQKFVAPEDQAIVEERYQRRIEGETPREEYQIELSTRRGERIPVELSVSVTHFNGDPSVIAVIRDIRNRTARERQLRVLDRVLRHNLRNAMTTIQGYAETMKRENDEVRSEADNILSQIDQLLETVDKEREIVDILCDPVEPFSVDMSQVCQRRIDAAAATNPAVEFRTDIEPGSIARATNDIGRVIEELIDNAIRHNDHEHPEVHLTVEQHDETINISIEDNGPGIPHEEIDVLTGDYEPDQLYHGSGLGLWLINWVVRQSDGMLTFEENTPRGSIVTIELEIAA